MTEAEAKNKAIREAHNAKIGSKKQTSDVLNDGKPPKDPIIFTMADVCQWYLQEDVGVFK